MRSPSTAARIPSARISAKLRHANLVAERDAMAQAIPADPGFALHRAEARVRTLTHELEALEKADGWGALRGTAVGEAAIAWKQAATERRACLAPGRARWPAERHRLRQRAERAAEAGRAPARTLRGARCAYERRLRRRP